MSLKDKFSDIERRVNIVKHHAKECDDKGFESTINFCSTKDKKKLNSIASDANVFNWKRYLSKTSHDELLEDYPHIEIDIVDQAISRLLLNFEMASSFIIKTDSNLAKKRLVELADFLSRVKKSTKNEIELEVYSAEFILNPTYTEIFFLVDGVRRFSSPFYRQLHEVGDEWGQETSLKLMAIDEGHIVQLIIKHTETKIKNEYVILNNLKGNENEF